MGAIVAKVKQIVVIEDNIEMSYMIMVRRRVTKTFIITHNIIKVSSHKPGQRMWERKER